MTTIIGIIAIAIVVGIAGIIPSDGWAAIAIVLGGIAIFFVGAYILRIAFFILIGKNPFKE